MSCVVAWYVSFSRRSLHTKPFHTFLHKAQHMYTPIWIMHVKSCPECGVHVLCFMQKRVCVKRPARKLQYVKDGDTNKKVRFASWSLSHSSIAVCCAGVSAFRLPIVGILDLVTITTMHCTVHHHAHKCGMAWQCGHVQHIMYHVTGMDTVGRSVSRSNNMFP